jgi:hypothetical protein
MIENSRLVYVMGLAESEEAMVVLLLPVINFLKDGVRKVMLNKKLFLLNEQDVNLIKLKYTKYLFYNRCFKPC